MREVLDANMQNSLSTYLYSIPDVKKVTYNMQSLEGSPGAQQIRTNTCHIRDRALKIAGVSASLPNCRTNQRGTLYTLEQAEQFLMHMKRSDLFHILHGNLTPMAVTPAPAKVSTPAGKQRKRASPKHPDGSSPFKRPKTNSSVMETSVNVSPQDHFRADVGFHYEPDLKRSDNFFVNEHDWLIDKPVSFLPVDDDEFDVSRLGFPYTHGLIFEIDDAWDFYASK